MEKIKLNDTAAFDELYYRYSQRLLVYFHRMLRGDAEKAQDFLQDLFVKIIDKKHLFREGARFYSWIYTLAHNMCKNEYRRLKVRKIVDRASDRDGATAFVDADSIGIENQLDNHHFKKLVLKELEKFDVVQRSTFILRFQEHLSIREISEILDCAEGTIKSRLFYVTKKLAKKLKEYHPQQKEVINHGIK
ncbi:sigma-70 family RNA polymerase sigma factor [Candidatus Saccharibacteria bacterium]|nr:sigma-70 family RNA polymerase sigma factor [Candidatus Saccharibacteria bacterium]NIV71659.1 sigma-70 family RNA polymerase sigma factor [Calditrichia bacterium]NIV98284.1 sigma-70 family RNA polymerase sigma factor [Candidatus Saccharibacteria bacterium]NIW78551.1 sigma-70 family RNA polymerase sigma factor [Calditrichia bacterium]